jgi:hypothetical protein
VKIEVATTLAPLWKDAPSFTHDDSFTDLKDYTAYQQLVDYYGNKSKFDPLLKAIKRNAALSLRLFDFFCTNYCRDHDVSIGHPSTGQSYHAHTAYRRFLQVHSKKRFDCFCRASAGPRIKLQQGDTRAVTNLAQLAFFRWAIDNGVFTFVVDHADAIQEDLTANGIKSQVKRNDKRRKRCREEEESRRERPFCANVKVESASTPIDLDDEAQVQAGLSDLAVLGLEQAMSLTPDFDQADFAALEEVMCDDYSHSNRSSLSQPSSQPSSLSQLSLSQPAAQPAAIMRAPVSTYAGLAYQAFPPPISFVTPPGVVWVPAMWQDVVVEQTCSSGFPPYASFRSNISSAISSARAQPPPSAWGTYLVQDSVTGPRSNMMSMQTMQTHQTHQTHQVHYQGLGTGRRQVYCKATGVLQEAHPPPLQEVHCR